MNDDRQGKEKGNPYGGTGILYGSRGTDNHVKIHRVNSKKKKSGRGNALILVVSGLMAVVGIVFFIISMTNKGEEQPSDDRQNVEATGFRLVIRQNAAGEGYTKEWIVKDGMTIEVRTQAELTYEAVPTPVEAKEPDIVWDVQQNDKIRFSVADRKITIAKTKDYGPVEVKAKAAGQTITFNFDIQHAGWNKTEDGKDWYFVTGSGTVAKNEWRERSKKKSYLNEIGVAVKGWREIDGKWYYFDENAFMVTGTQTIDGKEYQFNDNGEWLDENN